jgi:hypothetical protein
LRRRPSGNASPMPCTPAGGARKPSPAPRTGPGLAQAVRLKGVADPTEGNALGSACAPISSPERAAQQGCFRRVQHFAQGNHNRTPFLLSCDRTHSCTRRLCPGRNPTSANSGQTRVQAMLLNLMAAGVGANVSRLGTLAAGTQAMIIIGRLLPNDGRVARNGKPTSGQL